MLKSLDFQAEERDIIGAIGKNGAGKSTVLEILMTIRQHDSGSVQLFGEEISAMSASQLEQVRRQISVVLHPTQFYKI